MMNQGRINRYIKMAVALVLTVLVLVSSTMPAFAKDDAAEHIVLTVGVSEMQLGDETISIEDGVPVLNGGRVYVPLRAVAEGFGAEVDYDDATHDITIETEDTEVIMNTLASVYTVNGTLKWMDMAPYVNSDGRTMVPVRFVSDGLGYVLETGTDANGATTVTISRSEEK